MCSGRVGSERKSASGCVACCRAAGAANGNGSSMVAGYADDALLCPAGSLRCVRLTARGVSVYVKLYEITGHTQLWCGTAACFVDRAEAGFDGMCATF